jgi:hypothetical protein
VTDLRRWLPEALDPAAPGNLYARAAPLEPDELEAEGDFELCPISRERPRVMQMVCMEQARNLALHPKAAAAPGN